MHIIRDLELNHGVDYTYPHDMIMIEAQQYLPDKMTNTQYFHPKGNSKTEQQLFDVYQTLKLRQENGLN